MFWHNNDQARQRLAGTAVMFGDDPVLFNGDVLENCSVRNIRTGKTMAVNLNDDAFANFRRLPKVGFVNYPGGLFHLRRIPVRTQVHGLCRTNVKVLGWSVNRFRNDVANFNTVIDKYGKYYAEACREEFPSFAEAIQYVSREQPVAFSDRHAVVMLPGGDKSLIRDDDSIGVVTSDGTCLLPKRNLCYREELLEKGVPSILEL